MTQIEIAPKPKRRRGAQPGNLNGSKNAWLTFWRRRAVKESDGWIIPLIQAYADGLIADKGGSDNITAAEHRMVEIAQTARGASMLILKESSERGLIVQTDAGWDLAPGAKELAKFLNVERQALQTVGMKRRIKEVTLDDILREADETDRDSAPAAQGSTNGAAEKAEQQ